MPRYNNILAGFAILVLAFAPGAEAIVCGANEYLEMDGAYTASPAVANAPKCTACPTGMSNPAGVAGGYGDSANPRIAVTLAAAIAQASANTNLLTWCNRDAGYYFTADTSATSPGVAAACPTTQPAGSGVTTSPKLNCNGAACGGGVETAAADCVLRSNCPVNTYLSTNVAAQNAVVASCTACPTGMSAPLSRTTGTTLSGLATVLAAAQTAVKVYTYCDVDSGYYLSTATTAAVVGAATACPTASTRSLATSVAAAGVAAQAESAVCVVEKDLDGPTGPAGPTGPTGPTGAAGR